MAMLGLSDVKGRFKRVEVTAPVKKDEVTVVPTMVPALVKPGEGMLEVTTRQRFVTSGIDDWLELHTTRSVAIFAAAGAVVLFPVNLWLSAGAAALAGHFYGKHIWKNHMINTNLKNRKVLYTR